MQFWDWRWILSGVSPSASQRREIKVSLYEKTGTIVCPGFSNCIRALGFVEIASTDATYAKLNLLDRAILNNTDILNIRLEGTLDVFDNVHTDTAGLLSETAAGNATAFKLLLTAEVADVTHFLSLRYLI